MNTNLNHYQSALTCRVAMRQAGSRSQVRAFTFLELLAIVVVLASLALTFVPAMAGNRFQNNAIRCQHNLRQLTGAWSMYAADHDDRVANNFGVLDTLTTIQNGKLENWVNNIMSWSASSAFADRSNTNIVWLTNGVFGRYLGSAFTAYKCPSDTHLSQAQQAAGWTARLRSFSMNSLFGRFSTGIDPGFREYAQFLRQTSVPKPKKTWLFVDEHADSINDGYFINSPQTSTSWSDVPASYHNGGCSFSFADGHTELKRWRSRSSLYPVRYSSPTVRAFDAAGRADFSWYRSRTGYKKASTGELMFGY